MVFSEPVNSSPKMEPLAALGACSSILQIVDFSCKILSKGNQIRTSLSGVLPANLQIQKVSTHLYDLTVGLQRQHHAASHAHGQQLDDLVASCIEIASELSEILGKLQLQGSKTKWKSFRAAIKSVWNEKEVEEVLKRSIMIRDEIEFEVILHIKKDLVTLSEQQVARSDNLDQSTQAVLQAVLTGQSAADAASKTQTRFIIDMNAKLENLVIKEHQQTRDEILTELRKQKQSQNYSRSAFMSGPVDLDLP
ncbi:hypothetical protein ABW20_dc0110042 [Dactylellina cionopaga]|nr:hypothetical protein ABW20_dc0110042 [Dactylellina cionopaga]